MPPSFVIVARLLRCAYRWVMFRLLCSRASDTSPRSAPFWISQDANVCRRLWLWMVARPYLATVSGVFSPQAPMAAPMPPVGWLRGRPAGPGNTRGIEVRSAKRRRNTALRGSAMGTTRSRWVLFPQSFDLASHEVDSVPGELGDLVPAASGEMRERRASRGPPPAPDAGVEAGGNPHYKVPQGQGEHRDVGTPQVTDSGSSWWGLAWATWRSSPVSGSHRSPSRSRPQP